MPTLSAHALRLAFAWGIAGALLGGWTLIGKAAFHINAPLRELHLHFMLHGWMIQMVFATAYWIFPRIAQVRPRPALAVFGLVLWNSSLALNIAGIWLLEAAFLASLMRLFAAASLTVHFVPRLRGATA